MPDNPNAITQEGLDLEQAVGRCVLAWSSVEFALSVLFCSVLQTDGAVAHATFAAIRSFNARLKMLNDAFAARYTKLDEPPRSDWKLLYNSCNSLNALRNQVAHSFMVVALDEDTEAPEHVLMPYFVLTATNFKINLKDVSARTAQFYELRGAIDWLLWSMGYVKMQPPGSPRPTPDLVLRLRDEAARNRAKTSRPPR